MINVRLATWLVWVLCALSISTVHAANTWTGTTRDGKTLAKTPEQGWVISMKRPPSDGIWGMLYLRATPEQFDTMERHRVVQNFNFVHVTAEIDDFQRQLTARFDRGKELVSVELDLPTWNAMKLGSHMTLRFPEGLELKESLRGSSAVIRVMETEM